MKKNFKILLGTCFLLSISLSIEASVIYVNLNATGNQTGTSWENAYADLQDALDNATTNDEIWIAQGIYRPVKNEAGQVATQVAFLTFTIRKGISIYGGFNGTETEKEDLNPDAFPVILSGDFTNSDTIINPNLFAQSIVTCLAQDRILLRALTIEGGKGPQGAGINHKGNGELVLQNCLIQNNEGQAPSFAGEGGVLFSKGRLVIQNSKFESNHQTLVLNGGGSNEFHCTIDGCDFFENTGIGACIMQNGSNGKDTLKINSSRFSGNQAYAQTNQAGGVIFSIINPLEVVSSQTRIIITNSLFSGNRADIGSVIYMTLTPLPSPSFDDAKCTVINSTFVGNTDPYGCIVSDVKHIDIKNCIFWNNNHDFYPNFTTLSVSNSIVEDGCQDIGSCIEVISEDPLFIYMPPLADTPTTTGDFRLSDSFSPAIDFGVIDPLLPTTDLVGNMRLSGSALDAGAYEFQQETVQLSELDFTTRLTCYPNPASSEVTIDPNDRKILQINIVDSKGMLIFQHSIPEGHNGVYRWENVSNFTGICFIIAYLQGGSTEIMKVLIK